MHRAMEFRQPYLVPYVQCLALAMLCLTNSTVEAATRGTCPASVGTAACIYSPVDPSGSRGSQSTTIGLSIIEGDAISSDNSNDNSLLRAMITKGTPLPLDVGILLGASPTGGTQQVGAHVQWTLFEGFRLPALSSRASWLKTDWTEINEAENKLKTFSMTTSGIEFIAAWGVLGILTPYAGVGLTDSSGRQSWIQTAGIEIQAAPPFLRFAIESRRAFNQQRTLAKVSVGL